MQCLTSIGTYRCARYDLGLAINPTGKNLSSITSVQRSNAAMKNLCYSAILLGLLAGFSQPLHGQVVTSSTLEDAQCKLKEETNKQIRFLEGEFSAANRLRDRRVGSDDQVDFWRFNLAVARCDLAYQENKSEDGCEQLRICSEIRKSQLERALKLRGTECYSEGMVDEARRRVASAAYSLARHQEQPDEMRCQLKLVIEICEKESGRIRRLLRQGACTVADLEDAQDRLASARLHLAEVNGEAKEVIRQASFKVDIRLQKCEREKRLLTRGASSEEAMADYQVNLLRSQYRLAVEKIKQDPSRKNRDRLVSLTRSLVDVCGKRLELKNRNSMVLAYEKAYVKWEIAAEGYRQALASHGFFYEFRPTRELDG
jgi:hypothetical protein